jgi:hypothetical protein
LAPVSGKVIRQARNRSLIRRDVTAAEIIAVAAERWMRTRQVQPGPRARPRQRRVAPLAVDPLRCQHEGLLHGHALGLVGGDRIAMGQVAVLQIVGR